MEEGSTRAREGGEGAGAGEEMGEVTNGEG